MSNIIDSLQNSRLSQSMRQNDAGTITADDKATSNVVRMQDSTDSVNLSPEALQALDKAGFDAGKVERIKEAIANGDYIVDTKKLAKSFAEIEKLL
jgi:flagellar biosynthesis anti-sigma factor FlgM